MRREEAAGVVALPAAPNDRPTSDASGYRPFDGARLSYATTFPEPWRRAAIRAVEWATGKATLLRRIRQFEREGVETGQAFFEHALAVMGIRLDVAEADLRRIPSQGPVVVVANHPHGLVDGMVLAAMIGRVRTDYRILARSLLTHVPEVERFMIPVPFAHEPDARRRNLDMRARAMRQLATGGVVALFPAGAVAASRTAFGPVEEPVWAPFTAKLIRTAGATVVPVRFPSSNSRLYQVANRISPVLRQGLLLHEVVRALDRPQAPEIKAAIPPEHWMGRIGNATAFTGWLRDRTLCGQRVGTGSPSPA